MIDGIPNRPLYFYQKDIIVCLIICPTSMVLYDLYIYVYV